MREKLASRIGFIFVSAGCAIGLGNVWRFPYIVGKYGGGAFVLIYLFFLLFLGLPVMIMEFAIGRAGESTLPGAYRKLQSKGRHFNKFGHIQVLGNLILMMFYTSVSGWMLFYVIKFGSGQLSGLTPEEVGASFGGTVGNAGTVVLWMAVVVAIGFLICSFGLRKGVEKVSKVMMTALLVILIILVIRSVTLPGAVAGLEFYLKPNMDSLLQNGIWETVYAAMGQAFFTLSLGIGSMAIFGSYLSKERKLLQESLVVLLLDTFVAIMAGLIIFPAAFAYNVDPGEGAGLVFVTLPNIFNSMAGGRLWGTLFFIFMSFAALSTVIAVFENLISYTIDEWRWSRKKASVIGAAVLFVTSLPAALGFNVWSFIQPLGEGSAIIDLEDFIVSYNLLPLGSLAYIIFCSYRYGWGWDNFLKEANSGKGVDVPHWLRPYVAYFLPIVLIFVFINGYIDKLF